VAANSTITTYYYYMSFPLLHVPWTNRTNVPIGRTDAAAYKRNVVVLVLGGVNAFYYFNAHLNTYSRACTRRKIIHTRFCPHDYYTCVCVCVCVCVCFWGYSPVERVPERRVVGVIDRVVRPCSSSCQVLFEIKSRCSLRTKKKKQKLSTHVYIMYRGELVY
jgi:hypothetical protein